MFISTLHAEKSASYLNEFPAYYLSLSNFENEGEREKNATENLIKITICWHSLIPLLWISTWLFAFNVCFSVHMMITLRLPPCYLYLAHRKGGDFKMWSHIANIVILCRVSCMHSVLYWININFDKHIWWVRYASAWACYAQLFLCWRRALRLILCDALTHKNARKFPSKQFSWRLLLINS